MDICAGQTTIHIIKVKILLKGEKWWKKRDTNAEHSLAGEIIENDFPQTQPHQWSKLFFKTSG